MKAKQNRQQEKSACPFANRGVAAERYLYNALMQRLDFCLPVHGFKFKEGKVPREADLVIACHQQNFYDTLRNLNQQGCFGVKVNAE